MRVVLEYRLESKKKRPRVRRLYKYGVCRARQYVVNVVMTVRVYVCGGRVSMCVRACVQAAGGMNMGADRPAGVHIGSHVPAQTQRHAEQASYCCGY